MRSPNWNEEELKLALELYLSKSIEWQQTITDLTPEVQMLSMLLNSLDFYTQKLPDKFRSPSAIRMKLANFKSVDSKYKKSSLTNMGTLDREIWNKYHDQYEKLKRECKEIIDKHYSGKNHEELKEYISRYQDGEPESVEMEFIRYGKEVYSRISQYREKALKITDLEKSKRIIDSCYEIMNSLEWCNKSNDNLEGPSATDTYKEHAGINQVPIDMNVEKIGRHVQHTMEDLIAKGLISEKILANLVDAEWCKKTLHLPDAFLIKIDPNKDLRSQLKDGNGYVRYWTKPYSICGSEFCICKEWYERGRKYFDKWVDGLDLKRILDIESGELKRLLTYALEIDQEKISIDRNKLYSHMEGTKNKSEIVDELIELGVLSLYQGEEQFLIVEDYDLLFDMLEHSTRYAR